MPFLDVNNARLWYDLLGETGDVILMHHGYTASRVNWLPVAERLKNRYRVVLMECRGTGESEDTQDGYSIEQYGKDAIDLMSALEFDTFTFAGHSMGGGVGMYLALEHADRLDKLILMAAVGSKGLTGKNFRANLEARLKARREKNRDFFKKEQLMLYLRTQPHDETWIESRVDHLMRVSEGHLVDSLNAMQNMDFTSRLSEITIPTLVIAGGADPLLNTNIDDYRRLSNARLQVFFHAGHDVAIHEPEGVARAIDLFSFTFSNTAGGR